ncbi:MAG: PorV/PorQ family protein [Calditrichaeota bacterium]|nr:PorV/PorQ family protein [Calditrichota bacterium]MCB0288665.1 PorV/PorQ family protein [Calditrichota bacterium]MCB0294486.1 PorV/PorQ family protein [Calditrichota bacterium]MCB0302926.1 PorV/PorQ family protein [Calditrichota bacterium]MCB9087975.1 PorV/PorQ family protein [Calditrichia bacterium]
MRTKNISKWLLVSLLSLPLTQVYSQSGIVPNNIERVGQSGWQFLKINGDPLQSAMGGASTAISPGNANAVFGNPATLTGVGRLNIQFNNVNWIADIGHQSLALAWNSGRSGVFALSVVSLDYGDIPETVNAPIPGDDTRTRAVVTGSMFTARDLAAGLSYARQITDRLSLGGNIRWIRQEIAELSMSNWSIDFGTIYYTGFRTLRLAITARNFGPDSHIIGWSEEYQREPVDVRMPIDFRAGVAMDFFEDAGDPHRLTVVFEGDHPNDGPEKFHMGADYTFQDVLSLRGGYRFNYDEQGLSVGAGLIYSQSGFTGSVNYAYLDFGALNGVHCLSLGFSL